MNYPKNGFKLFYFKIAHSRGGVCDEQIYVISIDRETATKVLMRRFEIDNERGWVISEMKQLTGQGARPQPILMEETD